MELVIILSSGAPTYTDHLSFGCGAQRELGCVRFIHPVPFGLSAQIAEPDLLSARKGLPLGVVKLLQGTVCPVAFNVKLFS